ncbi:NACHT domain-containing protein [Corallococcus exiguus]|uniref:metallophosphoesterase n=1 Tax=Corallococcus exiguus TaxID=83462 RepID=UPI0014717CED|nr:metallophosphoesterase [Corallococcus exiguus]NNC14834.1 NACHT domain-containing protein [Corallococcus exiguus]
MTWPLTILQLSDLHFGPHGRFAGEDKRKLAERLYQDIQEARHELGWQEEVGLCIVTGDIAEAARPGEYEEAYEFFDALVGQLGLKRGHVIFVPGNHDVSWDNTEQLKIEQRKRGFSDAEYAQRVQVEKFEFFENFLRTFYGTSREGLPGVHALGHGAYVHSFPEERLAVAVLNSSGREDHRPETRGGFLEEEQAQALMNHWRRSETPHWLKVVAIHHNPVATVPQNVESWVSYLKKAKETDKLRPETIDHFVADAVGLKGYELLQNVVEDCQVQLVLHGHHHASNQHLWPWRKATGMGHSLVLSAGSWGLREDKLPRDQPNNMHLVRMNPESQQVRSILRVYNLRARAEGQVQAGRFAPDPACPQGIHLRLSLPEGFHGEQSVPNPGAVETGKVADFIREYRTRLKRRFERWDLRGVGAVQAGGAARPIEATLDDMYLPLRLREGFDPELLGAGSPLDPSTLLGRTKPLVLRGAAGCGKTTWMRWTFRRLVEMPDALPFMVELRGLAYAWKKTKARGEKKTLDAYLRDVVAESGVSGWKDALPLVFKATTGPRPVLLVDGWDELGELGDDLRDKLTGFLAVYPRVVAVVTSRPYGASRPSGSDGFEVLDLQPVSNEEISNFTQRFHQSVYGEDVVSSQKSTQLFQDSLASSPEALSLARTPLLLTMMLLISRDRALPDKRHLLYEQCIRNLLSARPDQGEREGVRLHQDQWRPTDSAERLRALSALAFGMQAAGYTKSRGQFVAASSELERMLPESWKLEEKRGFLAWLVGAAGVLSDRTDGTLSFAHLSFQEYLAAQHLAATLEGDDARSALCLGRMEHVNWWETLRLWAAIIEDRNPAHLSPVLKRLIQGEPAGFWLTGAILADGLGEGVFEAWCHRLAERFHLGEGEWADTSARAWRSSRQEGRRQGLMEHWVELSNRWTWLAALLSRDWSNRAQLGTAGEDALERLLQDAGEGQGMGRARVLFGFNPVWPGYPTGLAYMRLFSSHRSVSSMQLQVLLSLGGSLEELKQLARHCLIRRRDVEVRELIRELMQRLVVDWKQLEDTWRQGSAAGLALDLARHSASDMAQDVAVNWAQNQALDLAAVSAHVWAEQWLLDLARRLSRFWDKNLARNVARNGGAAQGDSQPPEWIADWMGIELTSAGRAWTRVATARSEPSRDPLHMLMRAACLASLELATHRPLLDEALSAYPRDGEPLWPALARHLARCSTREDRKLLSDLTQHPEKREEPLSSMLRYYVRGDLVLQDGSELTLDALCRELGLPLLPYLEEVPYVVSSGSEREDDG